MARSDERSLTDLKEDAARNRAEFVETVDQLRSKVADTVTDFRARVSPDAIKAEANHYFRAKADDSGQKGPEKSSSSRGDRSGCRLSGIGRCPLDPGAGADGRRGSLSARFQLRLPETGRCRRPAFGAGRRRSRRGETKRPRRAGSRCRSPDLRATVDLLRSRKAQAALICCGRDAGRRRRPAEGWRRKISRVPRQTA